MELLLWIAVFLFALFFLIKGADVFIDNAEQIGVFFGLPSFVIGVLIVGIGTSLPELASGLSATFQGVNEIVTANAIGSNIANILLIVGLLSAIGGRLVITKNLLDAELPFFVISTILFIGIVFDGSVTFTEALLLFVTYVIYLFYLFAVDEDIDTVVSEKSKEVSKKKKRNKKDIAQSSGLAVFGLAGVLGGAFYLIESVQSIGAMVGVDPALISITAIALGTSLPELSVSFSALKRKRVDMAIGNIFGSNAFNILLAVSIPGLIAPITLDQQTFLIGVPVLAAATLIFLVIGLARKIYRWEGFMFLVFYAFFILKLLGI